MDLVSYREHEVSVSFLLILLQRFVLMTNSAIKNEKLLHLSFNVEGIL